MRYIVKYNNTADQNASMLKTILEKNNIKLIDGSLLPEVGLIQSEERTIDEVRKIIGSSWSVFAEKKYKVPDTKHKISKKTV